MTPATVTGIAQALPPLLSNAKSNPSPKEGSVAAPPNEGADLTKDSKLIPVDTISISSLSRRAIADVTKEEAKKEETKKENSRETSDKGMAKVQFVYNMKGDLSMRYLDTANRLVYQVPSELMLRMKEAAAKSDLSVDTKA